MAQIPPPENDFEGLLQDDGSIRYEAPDDAEHDAADLEALELLTAALSEHAHLVFPPADDAVTTDETQQAVHRLLERDQQNETPGQQDPPAPVLRFPAWAKFAAAAAVVVLVAVPVWRSQHTDLVAVPTEVHFCAASQGATGYVLGIQGDVILDREGKRTLVTQPCYCLTAGDTLLTNAESQCSVLSGEGAFTLGSGKSAAFDGASIDVGTGRVQPEWPLSDKDVIQIAMLPTELIGAKEPPQLRGAGKFTMLSPHGRTYSDTPEFIWHGPSSDDYTVTVTDSGDRTVLAFQPQNGYRFAWSETGQAPLTRGATYKVQLTRDETFLLPEPQEFHVLGQDHAPRLEHILMAIDQTSADETARLYVRATILLQAPWQCYAEARMIAVTLVKHNPDSRLYLYLLRACYTKLGIAEGFRQASQQIDALEQTPQASR